MNDIKIVALILAGAIGFVVYINLLCMLIAAWSGWRLLAERFTHEFEERDRIGLFKSARMRGGCSYNNALKIASNAEGLWLATIAIVPRHEPLLIPWNEIKVIKRSQFLSWRFVTLQLGLQEQIPFTIYEKLFAQIQHQAPLNALPDIR